MTADTAGVLRIGGYVPDKGVASRLARDIRTACTGLTSAEMSAIVRKALYRAGRTTVSVRKRSFCMSAQWVGNTVQHVHSVGPKRAFNDACTSTREFAAALPGRTLGLYRSFQRMTPGRRVDEITQLLMTWLVFYGAAGQSDLEGGLPDLDLVTGIGNHRSVFSHSLLLGLEVEVGLRFALHMLHALIERMPADRHPVWPTIAEALDRYGDRALTGVWLGIGAHLINDAGLLHLAGTKPVVGLPWGMPMGAHKAFLAANGAACAAAASSKQEEGPERLRATK